MDPADVQQITDIVKSVGGGYNALGLLGAIAAALAGLVRLMRLPLVQRVLGAFSPRLQWSAWPKGAKLAFVFGVSTACAVLTALAGQTPLSMPVIVAGIVVGLGAIASNEVTEAVGAVAAPVINKLPASIRAPVGLMFPVPKSLEELRAIEAGRGPFMVSIIINGKRVDVAGGELDFDAICSLAGKRGAPLTITFHRGPAGVQGSLRRGESVPIADGMVFDAVYTGAA